MWSILWKSIFGWKTFQKPWKLKKGIYKCSLLKQISNWYPIKSIDRNAEKSMIHCTFLVFKSQLRTQTKSKIFAYNNSKSNLQLSFSRGFRLRWLKRKWAIAEDILWRHELVKREGVLDLRLLVYCHCWNGYK